MDKDLIYLEVWKKSRDTVEHLDRILSDFRKIICAIDAGILAVAGPILTSTCEKRVTYIAYLGLGLNLMNFLIWTLEKHYHHYLMVAAKAAVDIENQLKLEALTMLTHRLSDAKRLDSPSFKLFRTISIHYYDLMYIVPMIIGTIISFIGRSWLLLFISPIISIFEVLKIGEKLHKQYQAEKIDDTNYGPESARP
ncbi:MAG: hypothetical protein NTY34_07080 [Candidatus Omnitrophica bacterium]|nr:hypothetical protein [Candidatus Omnitrophota bacterium]